jgi:flagellar hook protein FlgE
MMRSLNAGVSGLQQYQEMMDVVGNNIANVNTVGYKANEVTLEDMISQTEAGAMAPTATSGGTDPRQVGLGVASGTISTIFTQGNLQTSSSPTDLAIQGNGFYILTQGGSQQQFYTRDGSFNVDANNNLVNPSNGMEVQGWMADANGVVNTSAPIQNLTIPMGELMTSKPTDNASYVGNLNSTLAAGPASDFQNTLQVYDSLGNSHLVTVTFEKTAVTNEWQWTASGPGITVGPDNTGVIDFDNNGNFVDQTGMFELDVAAVGAMSPLDVTPDFTAMTQFGTASTATVGSQDGYAPGVLQSFTIGQDGTITGVYSNGSTKDVGQIALATFRNPDGLVKTGSSNYQSSPNSGIADIGAATTGSRGSIISGSLEMSNVDLSQEFTNMIVDERAYQANSKIIQTGDEMLQTLIGLKR